MQCYTLYFIWKLLYMFRVVPPPIIRSANNCIYSIWYLSHLYCYLPLSWKSWNRFGCAVGGVRHPQHTQIYFDKEVYMFRTDLLSIIRSLSTIYTAIGICHASSVGCLLAWSGRKYHSDLASSQQLVMLAVCQPGQNTSPILTSLADSQQNQHDKYLFAVYTVLRLLMMDSRSVRNMQSCIKNKVQKYCISLAFIIRIYHDARSSVYQIYFFELGMSTK